MNLEELHGVLTASVTFTKGEEIKRNYSAAQGVGEQQWHSDVITTDNILATTAINHMKMQACSVLLVCTVSQPLKMQNAY